MLHTNTHPNPRKEILDREAQQKRQKVLVEKLLRIKRGKHRKIGSNNLKEIYRQTARQIDRQTNRQTD